MSCYSQSRKNLYNIAKEQEDSYICLIKPDKLGIEHRLQAVDPDTNEPTFAVHFWVENMKNVRIGTAAICAVHPIPEHLKLESTNAALPPTNRDTEGGTNKIMQLAPGAGIPTRAVSNQTGVRVINKMTFNKKEYTKVLVMQCRIYNELWEEPLLRQFLHTVFLPFKESANTERSRTNTPRNSPRNTPEPEC